MIFLDCILPSHLCFIFFPFFSKIVALLSTQNVNAILFTGAFDINQKYLCGNTPCLQMHSRGFSEATPNGSVALCWQVVISAAVSRFVI